MLTLTADRLRPEWTLRWTSSPQRLLVYPNGQHPMPQMFLANKIEYQNLFAGTPIEQFTISPEAAGPKKGVLKMAWDRTVATVDFSLK